MVPIDPNDGFFKLAVTLPDEKISDQPRLRNPEIDLREEGRCFARQKQVLSFVSNTGTHRK